MTNKQVKPNKREKNMKVVQIDADTVKATRGGIRVRSGIKGGPSRSQSDAQKT